MGRFVAPCRAASGLAHAVAVPSSHPSPGRASVGYAEVILMVEQLVGPEVEQVDPVLAQDDDSWDDGDDWDDDDDDWDDDDDDDDEDEDWDDDEEEEWEEEWEEEFDEGEEDRGRAGKAWDEE